MTLVCALPHLTTEPRECEAPSATDCRQSLLDWDGAPDRMNLGTGRRQSVSYCEKFGAVLDSPIRAGWGTDELRS